jgi:glucans biosynthesis protein
VCRQTKGFLRPLPLLSSSSFSRRQVLAGLGAAVLLASTALPRSAYAATVATGDSFQFSFDWLSERALERASQEHQSGAVPLPAFVEDLDYDSYRRIQFRPEQGLWVDTESPFHVHAYHPGWLFKEPVALFEVTGEEATPIAFSPSSFDYHDEAMLAAAEAEPVEGVAGFRINHPLNSAERFDEMISFLGASYFRALGRNSIYGLSARGLAVNSWREGPEEFPRFSEFYLARPVPGEPTLTIYASLDSPSVTGAYRFVVTPATEENVDTVVDVTARLYFRADIDELGVAPLTSMFLFDDANHALFDDYRPRVHDSNGLSIVRNTGETLWRALNNGERLGNAYFTEESPRRFGLEQRGRAFAAYQDSEARYERRPSLLIEPTSDWGRGSVRLVEASARLEADDNIVAFWVPEAPVRAGDSLEFSYRMRWGDLPPDNADFAHVVETRAGQGGISGVENAVSLRKFVVDFAGGPLADLDPQTELDVFVDVGPAELVFATVFFVPASGVWRMVIDTDMAGNELVELRAYVNGLGRKLTETWLYQWRANA